MTFRTGMKVVCIDVSPNPVGRIPSELKLNAVYVISGLHIGTDCDGEEGIYLAEIPDGGWPFKAYRFRPAVERKTDISIFTAILKPSKVDA